MLDGYKSYIVAALLAAVAGAKFLGWITADVGSALEGILLGGGIAALKSAVKKAG
jgi:hypothetical protein